MPDFIGFLEQLETERISLQCQLDRAPKNDPLRPSLHQTIDHVTDVITKIRNNRVQEMRLNKILEKHPSMNVLDLAEAVYVGFKF